MNLSPRYIDSTIAMRILDMLVTPIKETDAYKLGIIDEKGKELRKLNQLHNNEERDAYTLLYRLIYRIKKIIQKTSDSKRLVNYAAALSLVKEQYELFQEPMDLEIRYLDRLKYDLSEELKTVNKYFFNNPMRTFRQFMEDGVPANNAAATPGIDGFTPETLGVRKRKKVKLMRRNEV